MTGTFMDSISDKIQLDQQVRIWENKVREADQRYREAQKLLEQQDGVHRSEAVKLETTRARLEQTLAENGQLRGQVAEREGKLQRVKEKSNLSMSRYQGTIAQLRARAAAETDKVTELQAQVRDAENDVRWYRERWETAQRELGMGPVSIFG